MLSKQHYRHPSLLLLLLLFSFSLLQLTVGSRDTSVAPTVLDGFPLPPPLSAAPGNVTLEYIDPTLPPLLPGRVPKCSLPIFQHDFADTVATPPVTANYTPPTDCPAPWSRVVLELSGVASDVQKDRIAAIWIDGAEILRSSTPLPMYPGVFWTVRKDITRYTTLLRGPPAAGGGSLIAMSLENSNATYPGVYSINVTLHFYRGAVCDAEETPGLKLPSEKRDGRRLSAHPTIKGLYKEPADIIIPISNEAGDCCAGGYWLRIHNESDVQKTMIPIPDNTYRAVLEIYASAHADDKYWYANPLRWTAFERPDTMSSAMANGAFRQVVLTIDGKYAGSAVPFPVIYPSSVNPFFWAPVAPLAAYDHPSYDLDLTPFVGLLLKGREHEFGLVVRDAQPHWRVTANLHLWVDAWSDGVEGALVRYKVPPLRMSRQANWREVDGKSQIDGQAIIRFAGWVSSSKGNITTSVRHRIKFKSHVLVQVRGTMKTVEMEAKSRVNIRVEKDRAVMERAVWNTEAPMGMMTMLSNGGGGTVFERTKMWHQFEETRSSLGKGKVGWFSTVMDRQEAEGSVLVGEDGEAVWGSGDTKSTYKFRDDRACYLRTVNVVGGRVENDVTSPSCIVGDVGSN